MTVVDMRNFFTDCKVKLIEITDTMIYYAEEKQEEGHRSLFLLEYDRQAQKERVVANYILNDETYRRHYFAFEKEIVIVMEQGGSKVWALRLDKQSGEEKNLAQISFIGSVVDSKALDHRHILFYTVKNEEHADLLQEYEQLTGFSQIVYLYDLDTEKYYYVKDARICQTSGSHLIPYRAADGSPQLLVLDPYGDEQEKERCYREKVPGEICDSVWTCPLEEFFDRVAQDREIPMELLFCADRDGLLRYAGMDQDNLYFRAKYFPNNDQRICAFHKETKEKSVAAVLNLKEHEKEADFLIDTANARVYRVSRQEDKIEIRGVLNSRVRGKYTQELGDFIACVDDRFLIAKYIMSDDKDSFEFNSIFDVQNSQQQSYESRCAVQDNTVVLY